MKQKFISSFAEFSSYLSEERDEDDLLFRGQPSDDPLVPRIGRITLREKEALPDVEQTMLTEFKRQALPLLDFRPESDWDWLALAQHHYMATRLLDWTTNPFTALWFAVEKPPARNPKTKSKLPAVVWVFNASKKDYVSDKELEPFEVTRTMIFRPRHVTRRIVVQNGWFTVHKWMVRQKRFIPLENNNQYSKRLQKILIPPNAFSLIRRELDRCGFNAGSLFPELDGLCKHIQWQNTLLEDE